MADLSTYVLCPAEGPIVLHFIQPWSDPANELLPSAWPTQTAEPVTSPEGTGGRMSDFELHPELLLEAEPDPRWFQVSADARELRPHPVILLGLAACLVQLQVTP